MNKLVSTNPADKYSVIGKVTISSSQEISEKVQKANAAKKAWKDLDVQKRIKLLKPIYEEFLQRQEEMALLISKEMGKPITRSTDEVSWTLGEFKWFMENVGKAIADKITHEDQKSLHKIVYEPIGTVALITPWNFPFGMSVWGLVPNLLVGNTVVFKISEETPLVGKLIEEVFNNHGLPEGVFSEVYGAGEAGKQLSEEKVDFIWFTGSTKVGEALYKTAADKFIKILLEMGGSSPCIVFEDADIEEAAQLMADYRFQNCGQACDAIKRGIVHETILDKFVEKLKKVTEKKKVGNPLNKDTEVGSLVAKRQLILLQEQVQDAIDKGATVITGGKIPKGLSGAFYEPTILTNITKDMRVWKEEVFGPVLPVVAFDTEEKAIRMANDTIYGLTSRVITKNEKRAERVASQIEAGTVEINSGDRWLSCNPFGGYKQSGMGREHGIMGFRELCQVKVISKSK